VAEVTSWKRIRTIRCGTTTRDLCAPRLIDASPFPLHQFGGKGCSRDRRRVDARAKAKLTETRLIAVNAVVTGGSRLRPIVAASTDPGIATRQLRSDSECSLGLFANAAHRASGSPGEVRQNQCGFDHQVDRAMCDDDRKQAVARHLERPSEQGAQ